MRKELTVIGHLQLVTTRIGTSYMLALNKNRTV
jgi:hypothetical protein